MILYDKKQRHLSCKDSPCFISPGKQTWKGFFQWNYFAQKLSALLIGFWKVDGNVYNTL